MVFKKDDKHKFSNSENNCLKAMAQKKYQSKNDYHKEKLTSEEAG